MAARGNLLTFALLFLGMALFGSATPLSKLVVEQFPVFTASLFRVLVGALVVLPFLGRRLGQIRRLTRRDWLAVGAIAVVGMFGFTTLLLYGMRLIPGVIGAIVMSTAPAVTASASVLLLSDSWSRRKLIAIGLAVTGVVIVNTIGRDAGAAGDLATGALILGSALVFGAVCCEAGYTLIGKVATERLDPMLTVFLASAVAIPLFLAPAAAIELRSFEPSGVDTIHWAALLAWGGGTLGLGSILWYAGLQRASGTVAAGFMGVMPVSALVFSYVLLGEPVHAAHLIGFAIVLCGVVLISMEHMRHGS